MNLIPTVIEQTIVENVHMTSIHVIKRSYYYLEVLLMTTLQTQSLHNYYS